MVPKLKIVPIGNIIPAVPYDENHVVRLIDDMSGSGFIRNLISLACIGKHRFLSLDDSDGVEAIRRLGLSSVPAQPFDMEKNREIDTRVVISSSDIRPLAALADIFPRQMTILTNREDSRNQKNRTGFLLATISSASRSDFQIEFHRDSRHRVPTAFFYFLDLIRRHYSPRAAISTRPSRSGNIKGINDSIYLQIGGLYPADLQFMMNIGFLFPSGMLHLHPDPKVLGINFPITVLSESAPTREKERFLNDLFMLRIKSGYADYFRGGVYLLNS
jgi:hypothetical protein